MKVTTSSPSYTNKLAKQGMDYISDEDLRAHYGIVEPLTGEDLDNECLKIQQQRNAEWKAANPEKRSP